MSTIVTYNPIPAATRPCGCIPGRILCNVADRLWRSVQDAILSRTYEPDATQADIDNALADFVAHFREAQS